MAKEPKKFDPEQNNPLPWKILEVGRGGIWIPIIAANGKRVCNCRNIKDAELIVKCVNGFDELVLRLS